MGRQKQQIKILSGFECVEPKILRKQILKSGSSSYSIANIPIPKNSEYQHMMITGTTGAGKSNMIHQLLEQIRKNGDQAIVLDTTGGIFSRFYDASKDILMNPLDDRSSHWNMWEEATNDHVIDEISESIIPDTRSMDSFWTQGARQLFGESVRFLKKNDCLVYDELLAMTLRMSLKDLHKYIGHTAVASLLDPSIEKTALSVRASLANHMRVFDYLEDSENGLSLIKFMKDNVNDWLFLSCQTDQRAFLKPIFSVWLSLIIKGMMTRQENNGSRTWIIIDELASLNKLPSLMTGLAEIRKYGGCFVLGFQDLSQVEDIYGQLCAKTLSNLTGTKVLFRAVDTDVATRVARYMGEQEKEELSTSISYGAHQMRDGVNLNQQRQVKAVVNASQIMLLQDLEAYVKFPGQFPVSKIQFSYLHIPHLNEVYKEKVKPKKENSSKSENLDKDVHEASPNEEQSSNIVHPSFHTNNVIQGDFEHKKNRECMKDNLSFDLE